MMMSFLWLMGICLSLVAIADLLDWLIDNW